MSTFGASSNWGLNFWISCFISFFEPEGSPRRSTFGTSAKQIQQFWNSVNIAFWNWDGGLYIIIVEASRAYEDGLFCSMGLMEVCFVIRMSERTSRRTFLNELFIWNVESFWRISPTLTYPMSFIVRVGSHCVTSRSLVLPCWSRSFTPTCMELILQYLSFILTFEVCASWLPRMWVSEDCVQRWDDLCFLGVPFYLGWSLIYTM